MVSKNGPALLHATALALLNGLEGTPLTLREHRCGFFVFIPFSSCPYPFLRVLTLIPFCVDTWYRYIFFPSRVYTSCRPHVQPHIIPYVHTNSDRLKTADFERAMKLVTSRIDVRNDDRLMHLVFKEAIANGAVEIWAARREIWNGAWEIIYCAEDMGFWAWRHDLLSLKDDLLGWGWNLRDTRSDGRLNDFFTLVRWWVYSHIAWKGC